MLNSDTLITFGVHNGKYLSDPSIPDLYIKWIAKRGSYPEPGNRFVCKWKVPIVLAIYARREMERRDSLR